LATAAVRAAVETAAAEEKTMSVPTERENLALVASGAALLLKHLGDQVAIS
jgi:hypothetical protein